MKTHIPPKPKPVTPKAEPERTYHTRQRQRSTSQTKSNPSRSEGDNFRALMETDSPHAADVEPISQQLFHLWPTPQPTVSDEHPGARTFHDLSDELGDEIEKNEVLPAEFELVLSDAQIVPARMTQGEDGMTTIALGFTPEQLDRVLGYERQGEQILKRRLGKSVRLHFKQVDAL